VPFNVSDVRGHRGRADVWQSTWRRENEGNKKKRKKKKKKEESERVSPVVLERADALRDRGWRLQSEL